jgi:hypothetical protein
MQHEQFESLSIDPHWVNRLAMRLENVGDSISLTIRVRLFKD